jgi:hypothetical protein
MCGLAGRQKGDGMRSALGRWMLDVQCWTFVWIPERSTSKVKVAPPIQSPRRWEMAAIVRHFDKLDDVTTSEPFLRQIAGQTVSL